MRLYIPRKSGRCLALIALSSVAGAQTFAAPPSRLIGVYDASTGEPVVGVNIRDSVSGSSVQTSNTGSALLSFVEFIGPFAWIEARKIGYQPVHIRLNARDTTAITLLIERAVALPAVVATAPYRLDTDPGNRDGFERRCAVRNVSCVRGDVISAYPARVMSEIYWLSGADVVRTCVPRRNIGKACGVTVDKCIPRIFVDGFSRPSRRRE
jgi:hypothetical protein